MSKLGNPGIHIGTTLPPPLFDLKMLYFYVIEVADTENQLCLHCNALVSEILGAFRKNMQLHAICTMKVELISEIQT